MYYTSISQIKHLPTSIVAGMLRPPLRGLNESRRCLTDRSDSEDRGRNVLLVHLSNQTFAPSKVAGMLRPPLRGLNESHASC